MTGLRNLFKNNAQGSNSAPTSENKTRLSWIIDKNVDFNEYQKQKREEYEQKQKEHEQQQKERASAETSADTANEPQTINEAFKTTSKPDIGVWDKGITSRTQSALEPTVSEKKQTDSKGRTQTAADLFKNRVPIFPNADGTKAQTQEVGDILNRSDFERNYKKGASNPKNKLKTATDYEAIDMDGGAFQVTDYDAVKAMDDEQIKTYNYLLGKYGESISNGYFNRVKKENADKISAIVDEDISDTVTNGGARGKAAAVAANMTTLYTSPLGYGEGVVKGIKNEQVDTNSVFQRPMRSAQVANAALTKDMGFWGQMLTNTGVSMGKSALGMLTGAAMGNSKAGSALMGLDAAASKTYENAEKGITPRKNLASATASGIAEGFFEKYSIENFLDMTGIGKKGIKELAKHILKQSGVEASEELFTEYANELSDLVILGDKSDIMEYYNDLVAKGEDKSSAAAKTALEYGVINPGQAALGGAISGAVFGGVGHTIGSVQSKQLGAELRESGAAPSAAYEAAQGTYGDKAEKLAKDMIYKAGTEGKNPTDVELGEMIKAAWENEQRINEEYDKNVGQARKNQARESLLKRFDDIVNGIINNKKPATSTQTQTVGNIGSGDINTGNVSDTASEAVEPKNVSNTSEKHKNNTANNTAQSAESDTVGHNSDDNTARVDVPVGDDLASFAAYEAAKQNGTNAETAVVNSEVESTAVSDNIAEVAENESGRRVMWKFGNVANEGDIIGTVQINGTDFVKVRDDSGEVYEINSAFVKDAEASNSTDTNTSSGVRAAWDTGITSGSGEIVSKTKSGNSDMYVIRTDDGKTVTVNSKYVTVQGEENAVDDNVLAEQSAGDGERNSDKASANSRTDTGRDRNAEISKGVADRLNDGVTEIDFDAFFGAVNDAKPGDEIRISDYAKNESVGGTDKTEQAHESDVVVGNDENVINKAKEVEGLKLVDTEKSTLFDGKTLITGVYELNPDKDFSRQSFKKEKYDVLLSQKPWIKSVDGTTYGHYGFSKSANSGYAVTYLPTGTVITFVDTQNKAKLLTKAFEDELPSLPLTVKTYNDGYRVYGISEEVRADVKRVAEAINESTDEITLPLKNKKELMSYLNKHKGDKIGVSFNGGDEDIRTIISASDSAIVTESADGERSRLDAQARELSYTDDGFVYTGSNGITAYYRFVSEDEISNSNSENKAKEGKTNEGHEVLAGKSVDDGRGLQSGALGLDEQGGAETADGQHRTDGTDGVSASDEGQRPRPDDGNDRKRADRTDDTGEVKSESKPASDGRERGQRGELLRGRDNAVSEVGARGTVKQNKNNFIITNDIAQELDTKKPNAEDNIKAMELLLELESSGRAATAEDRKILAKYKGWGGINVEALPWNVRSKLYNLYTTDEMRRMDSSTNNAFFTPIKVIDAIYSGIKRMGFKGGNVLEPSMGVGNFFGRMPPAMAKKSALTGVELETYTARIAQYLYPDATVINKPFQDVIIKNGSFELAVGNVPFGTNKITYNKKKYSLHNYFIVSTLDKLSDGGVAAFITSSGTLDNSASDVRKIIMDKADVVAAFKLPAKVFSRNANTDVQTDLLILRKRANGEEARGDSILDVTETADGLKINEYFQKHPENVLGTLAAGTNAWGKTITTVVGDADFYTRLEKAMKNLPKDLFGGEVTLKATESIITESSKPQYFEKDGVIYFNDGTGTAEAVPTKPSTTLQTIKDYMSVRDAYKTLLEAYDNDLPESEISGLRKDLSAKYDDFYKKHTAISGDGKKKIGNEKCKNNSFLAADSDYYLCCGLEIYDKKAKTFKKSTLFEKDTLRKKTITHTDGSSEALAVALNESGKVDFKRMEQLTGKSEKELLSELEDEVVFTPDGEYELTDIYLSGNIYEKLERIKGNPEFKKQEQMLKAVLPTPKSASDISVKLGANYIDPKYVMDFVREVLGERVDIQKNSSGKWVIDGLQRRRYGELVNVKYGCASMNAIRLLDKILNDGEITINKKVDFGGVKKDVFDAEMTDIAKQKADDIRDAFEAWVFKDTNRRNTITDAYNRTYNNYRPLDYTRIAEKLTFDSMNNTLRARLYQHQKNGIARFLFGGNVLFAHGVGTGKTFEMIASVMEAKRMGIVNKTAMVVPNNKVVDFRRDIAEAYPSAKVLVIDTANKKRQSMLGMVNSNDWDIILIARTTFTKIPVSKELQTKYISGQLEELDVQIAEAKGDPSVSKRQISALNTQRDNLENKLKTLDGEINRDDDGIEFEKLGIDCICVDEAHNYKSIVTPTRLNIKGLVNKNNAQMASDMLMKLDYLRSINGRIVFGTGTPITNTVSEIYNMMRMVRPDILEDAGIRSLDEWVNTFAKIENVTELGIDNAIKKKSTQIIKSFMNASEMVGMFRQFADIVFTEDVVKNLPKAVYKDIEIPSNSEMKTIYSTVSTTLANTPAQDMLKVHGELMGMMDNASIDLKLLSGADKEHNPFKDYTTDELEHENSKINTMCDYVANEYKSSDDIKGTQIIFCDGGAGTGKVYKFNVHKDIVSKLIERGIPKEEIVIVKNQNDAKLEELYEKVNSGEVRVLIGTSAKMAEGLNVQERVVAIHHPTVTYKPSDWEQGNARGVRSGNINDEVRIYRYLQENTFDSHKWQAQERKGAMIRAALKGDKIDYMEDIGADDEGGASVDAATAMAITSGNPLVKEKIDIDKEVKRLKTLKRNYLNEQYRYQDIIDKNPDKIRKNTDYVKRMKSDIAQNAEYTKAEMIVRGKVYEKQSDANKALLDTVKTAPKNGERTKIGEYNGFDILFSGETGGQNYSVVIKGANEYEVEYTGNGNNMARIAGVLNRLGNEADAITKNTELMQRDLEFAKQEVTKPFEQEAQLSKAAEKQKDITYQYEHYGEEMKKDDGVRYSLGRKKNTSSSTQSTAVKKAKKEPVKSIQQIISETSKRLKVPVGTGKITNHNANGVFKTHAKTIRLRVANDLRTFAHELGHYFDDKYGFSDLEQIDEVIKNDEVAEFLTDYSPREYASEAFGEFMRVYLTNRSEAERTFPKMYAEFNTMLDNSKDKDIELFRKAAQDMNNYMSVGISEKMSAAILTRENAKKLYKTPLNEKLEQSRMDWVDPFAPIERVTEYASKRLGTELFGDDNAYVLATNTLNATSKTANILQKALVDMNGYEIGDSFFDCLTDVRAKDLKEFEKYLVACHAPSWIDRDMRVFADDDLNNVDAMNRMKGEYEAEHPEFKDAAEKLYKFQNQIVQAYLVDTGIITQAQAEAMQKKYPKYVPFMRVTEKGTSRAKSTIANQSSPIKEARGSGLAIQSPLESIVLNTQKYVTTAMRNRTMQVLAEYADNIEGFGEVLEAVPPDVAQHITDISRQTEILETRLGEQMGGDSEQIMELFNEILGDRIVTYTIGKQKFDIISVLENGEKRYYQVHDRNFLDAISELTPKQLNGFRTITKLMNVTKALQTGWNYKFGIRNPIRDYMTGYKNSIVNNPFEYAKLWATSFFELMSRQQSEELKQYYAMGGGHSSELSDNFKNIKDVVTRLNLKDESKAKHFMYMVFRHPFKSLAMATDFGESIPRYAEFKAAKKQGADNQQASYLADKVTTNFKRSGRKARTANKFFFYLNPSIQGIDVFYDNIKSRPIQMISKLLIPSILGTLVRELWNRYMDKDGWENLSQYTKNNNYCYAMGNGKFFKIPKAREVSVFDSFCERAFDSIADGNKDLWWDFASYAAENLLPNIVPTAWLAEDDKSLIGIGKSILHETMGKTLLGPISDIGFNKDYKGSPIVSESVSDLPKAEQYNGRTSILAAKLGQMFNMSPMELDHLLTSSTGVVGSAITDFTAVDESERKPLFSGLENLFIVDSNYSTDVINRVYSNRDKTEERYARNSTPQNGIDAEKCQIISAYTSGMIKAIRTLPYEEQSNARGEMFKVIKSMQQSSGVAADSVYDKFKDSLTDEFKFISLPSSVLERTQDGEKQMYQMSPDEYNQMIQEIITEAEKTRQRSLGSRGSDEDVAQRMTENVRKTISTIKATYKSKYNRDFVTRE